MVSVLARALAAQVLPVDEGETNDTANHSQNVTFDSRDSGDSDAATEQATTSDRNSAILTEVGEAMTPAEAFKAEGSKSFPAFQISQAAVTPTST